MFWLVFWITTSFQEKNLSRDISFEMLHTVLPLILEIINNKPEAFKDMEIVFVQDGAPPHFYQSVKDYWDQIYIEEWICRRG